MTYAKTVLDMLRGTHSPRKQPVEPTPEELKRLTTPPPAPVRQEPKNVTPPRPRPQVAASSDCDHQWQWKDGVKSCWLCGQPEDIRSRRDKSTTWQAKVYGGKR